jgi:tetratricopeptide (TPR) repeat protein
MYCACYASDHAEHSFLAGTCLQRLGQPASAAHFYRVALQLDEADAASAYRLGECLEAVGQTEEASHLYRWTIELARGDFALRTLQDMASSRISRLGAVP